MTRPARSGPLTAAPSAPRPPAASTLLDAGRLPVEQLAALAQREARRPRPVYGAHRWFARRLGTAFRALLVGAHLPADAAFFDGYYAGVDLAGTTVLDPFVGGGTSVVEAQRLGATVIGIDVDPVACAVSAFESRLHRLPDLAPAAAELAAGVGARLAPLYRTVTPQGEEREVLHYFWVQVVVCGGCGQQVECHPHYQLAYQAEGKRQWVLCAHCHAVADLDRTATELACAACGQQTTIAAGPVRYGRLRCPSCNHEERLIEQARRSGAAPSWRLIATESLEPPLKRRPVPMAQRRFRPATDHDLACFEQAAAELAARGDRAGALAWVPDQEIPREGRADSRLPDYGYRRYRELFNARQLLHLSYLAEAIAGYRDPVREALALAFSDHLATNCMLTCYAFGWRRLVPLFAVRSFRHVPRPVEINPWSDGTGRGTFPNAVRQVVRAAAFARHPKEPTLDGGFQPAEEAAATRAPAQILHGSAERLETLEDASVDVILTDPPYFDNVCYSELADFYRPWLELLGAIQPAGGPEPRRASLAASSRGPAAALAYTAGLTRCFSEMARVLRPGGRVVFTFQHRTDAAWTALGEALAASRLRPVQLFPLLGDGGVGLHAHAGASTWDAVFVLQHHEGTAASPRPAASNRARWNANGDARRDPPASPTAAALAAADAHAAAWAARLEAALPGRFRQPDRASFQRACRLAAHLGLFNDAS